MLRLLLYNLNSKKRKINYLIYTFTIYYMYNTVVNK